MIPATPHTPPLKHSDVKTKVLGIGTDIESNEPGEGSKAEERSDELE